MTTVVRVATDFRQAIEQTEAAGELIRITREVDSYLELPSLTVKFMNRHPSPTLFFEKITGRPNWRGACGMFSDHHRLARLVDFPADRLQNKLRFFDAFDHPIPPLTVTNAPCQEVVHVGDNLDVEAIIPPTSGAKHVTNKYVQTAVFTRHPRSGDLNVGMYRCCLQGGNRVTINGRFEQHMGMQLSEAMDMGVRMPIALCIAVPPAVYHCAGSKLPYHVNELDVAGAVQGQPVPVVKCKTNDLVVPADAEVVIEGELRPPFEFGNDGPWPEYLRYLGMQIHPPVLHVTAITHRGNPINNYLIPGGVPHMLGMASQAAFLRYLQNIAGEYVVDAWMTSRSVAHHAIIKVRKRRIQDEGLQINLGLGAFGFNYPTDIVTIVDEDVDIYDLGDVDWAVSTRCDPTTQIHILPPGRSQQVNPIAGVKDALGKAIAKGKLIVDATIPWEYRQVEKLPGIGYFTRSEWLDLNPAEYLSPADQARWIKA